jgi:hypothetical protein
MSRRSVLLTILGLAVTAVGGQFSMARAAGSSLPALSSPPDEALSAADRVALTTWTLAQPEIRALLDGKRFRVLGVGTEHRKNAANASRRGTVLIRDYDLRVVHKVVVDLGSGDIEVHDVVGPVQPSDAEVSEAMDLIRSDPALADLLENPSLNLDGGFYVPSPDSRDPCARDLCLQFGFMKPNFERPPARMLVVDLTRRRVVSYDYMKSLDAGHPERMTTIGGN